MAAKDEMYVTLDEISVETLNSSQEMAGKKKGRNKNFIVLNKKFRRAVPEYDILLPQKIGIKTILDYTQNRIQQLLGRHKNLWWLISKLKKDTSHYK